MKKNKVKKENPPARLLWTMFLLVLGMVIVYGTLVLGIFALVQRLVRLDESNYTLVWPILFLTVSAILGVALAIFFSGIFSAAVPADAGHPRLPPGTTPYGWSCGGPGARWRSISAASTKWLRSWAA